MKNQKLISRNVIRRFAKGDIIKVNNLFYMDNGNGGVIPVYELRVPGSSASTTFKGKTYYYTPSNDSFTPNPEIQRALNLNNISKVNETANMVLSLANLYNTTRRLSNRNLSTTRSNSNRNLSRNLSGNLLVTTSSNRTNTNVEPWGMDLIFNSPLQFLTNVSLTSQDILRVLPLRVQTSNVNNENIPMWGLDLIFTSPLLRILLNTNSLSLQLEVQLLLSNHRPFFEEYPYYTELEVQQNLTVNNKQKSKKKTSQTITTTPQKYFVPEGVDLQGFTIDQIKANLIDSGILVEGKSDLEIADLFRKYLDEQNAKVNIELPPKQEEKKEETPSTSPFAGNPNPSPVNLNRADIRAILNHYGLLSSPSLRKSLRKFLGGDRELDISWINKDSGLYRDWVAPFVVFKKRGGLLPRNTVTRFKNKI